jgi:hypothetical protein
MLIVLPEPVMAGLQGPFVVAGPVVWLWQIAVDTRQNSSAIGLIASCYHLSGGDAGIFG